MNNATQPQQTSSLGLDDALYILFRHKFKIIFFTIIGLAAAAGTYLHLRQEHRSQAKLLVRYITEKKNPLDAGPKQSESQMLDPRDNTTMSAEAEILQS